MGRCIVAGGKPDMVAPSTGILASDLVVGSVVKLMENGVATDYLVVNQGKPSGSSLYDDSCDGLWLLRKDIHSKRSWNVQGGNTYASSAINTWLNGNFFNSFGNIEKAVTKQVKIPYCVGNNNSTVISGVNGLSVKAFLLGSYEVGWNKDISYSPIDGAKLSFFESGTGTSSNNKRIAFLNKAAEIWRLRSPVVENDTDCVYVYTDGSSNFSGVYGSLGVRPALVLPSNALFDKNTMLLKGVA